MTKALVSARIDGVTHRALLRLAESHERSISYLVRKAVEDYVEETVEAEAKGDQGGAEI